MAKVKKTIKKVAQKQKIPEMQQAHGAVSSYINFYDNIYHTNDFETYSSYLNGLDNAELHDHSVGVGEVPIEERTRLIDRLERRFLSFQSRAIVTQECQPQISSEAEKSIKKFMMRGV